ncbi:MAG: universal stress protein, partial [Bifidobacterium longum]|nr:universal stress protein [Bifidobacterium longum]
MSEATTKPDIVVGVDGSDESFAALKWALEEASLTGQSVNAVFGWTHSWDMGSEPDSDEAWAKVRHDIANELRVWVDKAAAGIDFDPANLKLTSVKASGTTDAIANALTPGDQPVHYTQPQPVVEVSRRPVVVGVDGSETSRRAFDFALEEARLHDTPLHVMFCWQLKDLGVIPGYENAVAPVKVGQRRAEEILSELMAKARIPDGVKVSANAFHIPASKGLIAASRYASHLVVGSRGLSG